MENKPSVLILGGCGFIGRNMVTYLIENDLTQEIRVVDKTPPQMAWLNDRHNQSFDNKKVEFCSANLINAESCKNAFTPHPITGRTWDLVFNCAAETRPNQTEAVYKEGILKLSMNCANEAANIKVKRFIELSSGCVNSSEKVPQKEDCKHEPWTSLAKQKLKVERELETLTNVLDYTVVRLPIVYGLGDKRYLLPRVIVAAIYKYLNECMKLLWNESMRLNTVHVDDVCAAMWFLALNPAAAGEIYNIVDDADSTQGTISDILSDVFSINVDYFGVVMSNLTKLSLSDTVSDVNDKHMTPWAEICQKNEINNTPLTPYLDEEQLYHKHLYLDNTKLKTAGYQLKVPKLTRGHVIQIIEDYIKQKLFPKSLMV
ncbi:dTDP-D-glucose 4,6-dehydratase [Bactrocera oleae]|uniref:dTDP-D-glucose 4,6-dehydratase n=1 Tax=Bactrocera oleae TaxID=104688 RepID=UPI0006B6FA1B|nr:dTDP-D-glucose 4,6-dehydratase isoform X1 [Bactrocera oleae]